MGKSFLADIPGNHFPGPQISNASIASGAGSSVLGAFVAPADLKILSAWRVVLADEATQGSATTSASYRRHSLVNGGTAGTGTTVLGSLNQTASQAANTSKAFTLAATPTVAKGELILLQQTTVGGAANDGTVVQAGLAQFEYELL